jgi:hypothetical protein
MTEHKAKKLMVLEEKVDGIMGRTKDLVNRINNNLYSEIPVTIPTQKTYVNPFVASNEEYLDTLDKLNVLEYDIETIEERNLSMSDDTVDREDLAIDIKHYDTLILKIEDLVMTDDRTLGQFKNNLLYIECRVPLFKAERTAIGNTDVFYDTFK